MTKERKIPTNLDECIEVLSKNEGLNEFLALPERDAIGAYHHSTGMALRNQWKLWGDSDLAKWFNSIGIKHADDMTGIIFASLHRKLHNKPIELESQVKFYQDYWKNIDNGKVQFTTINLEKESDMQ